jgi:hypothetical protein
MDLIETNFTRRANYWVGVAVIAMLSVTAWLAVQFIFR